MKNKEEVLLKLSNNQKLFQLALIDDLVKTSDAVVNSVKRADNSWKAYQNYLTRADAPFKEMMSARQIMDSNYSKSVSLISAVEKQAKDLGVSPDSLKGFSALKNGVNQMKEIFSVIDSFKDPSSFQ